MNNKKIGVLTSGGDSQGMNAAVYAVVRYGVALGYEVYGFKRGYKGLIDGDYQKLTAWDVDGVINRGGTFLKTARCPEMKTEEGMAKAYETLKKLDLCGLVVIGGDGSFNGASVLSHRFGVNVIGIPGTIDNDLAYTNYTLGFDSAVNMVAKTITALRDTMSANDRSCVVQVMGRNCGDIALYAGIASGAEMILVPEVPYKVEDVLTRIRANVAAGKTDNMIVLAEGAGSAVEMEDYLKPRLLPDHHLRSMVVGHLQRGDDATSFDIFLGLRMGKHAVECLNEGLTDRVVGIRDNKIIDEDIHEALAQRKTFDMNLYNYANKLVDSFTK